MHPSRRRRSHIEKLQTSRQSPRAGHETQGDSGHDAAAGDEWSFNLQSGMDFAFLPDSVASLAKAGAMLSTDVCAHKLSPLQDARCTKNRDANSDSMCHRVQHVTT
jgi:hypothetical protein